MDIEENSNNKRGRGRGRGTRSRGRGRGRGRGRAKKNTSRILSSDEEISLEQIEETVITDEITSAIITETVEDTASNKENENDSVIEEPIIPPTIDMEADISQLEAPTFTTISRGPPEPMLRLKWDHKVSLIGEKVLNPMIHCCDQCDKPILVYGRMIPCKHIFCLKCARQEPVKICPRCKDKVLRVEQSGLGTVFMCTHGGSRYGNNGCRRTYLSQRDLQAHINHRHITPQQQAMSSETLKTTQIIDNKGLNITPRKSVEMSIASSSTASTSTVARLSQRSSGHQFTGGNIGGVSSVSVSSASSSITSSSRGNLINVPIQEAQQALGKGSLQQQQQVSSTVVSSLNQLSVHHHGPAAEQVASASYYSNALLSYSGPNRPHAHAATHTSSTSHTVLAAQNYGTISSIGSQSGTTGGISSSGGMTVPTQPPPVTHSHNPLVPPPAHLSSQQSVVPPPPPPAPPQAPAYYATYGQQYGQMPHYQFDQTNYPSSGAPNPSQWNQQQYYR